MLLLTTAAGLVGYAPQARADVFEINPEGQWQQINKKPLDMVPMSGRIDAADPGSADMPPVRLSAITTLGEPIAEQQNLSVSAAPASVPVRGNYAPIINAAAKQYGISPALVDAVMWQESRYNHNAVSSAGAIGLMQLMPGTARTLGVNPRDPWQNVFGGAAYLRQQLDRFNNSVPLALAAYNAGPGAVQKYGGIPPYTETRNYVQKIVQRLNSPKP